MNVYTLKKLNKIQGGLYFAAENMAVNRDTLANYTVTGPHAVRARIPGRSGTCVIQAYKLIRKRATPTGAKGCAYFDLQGNYLPGFREELK